MRGVLEALAEDLRSRGGFDLEEAFIDGESASPHEVTLVQQTLAEIFVEEPVSPMSTL
jgi:hypothetical protein